MKNKKLDLGLYSVYWFPCMGNNFKAAKSVGTAAVHFALSQIIQGQ